MIHGLQDALSFFFPNVQDTYLEIFHYMIACHPPPLDPVLEQVAKLIIQKISNDVVG